MKKIKCPYGIVKKDGKCKLKSVKKHLKETGFKDKDGKMIYLGDVVKVYNSDVRKVKWDRAWNIEDREKVFGVTSDKQHKPLYRFGAKNIKIIKKIRRRK